MVDTTLTDSAFLDGAGYHLFDIYAGTTDISTVQMVGNSLDGATIRMSYDADFSATELTLADPDPTVNNPTGLETFYKTYTPIGALAFECALGDCGTLVESDITSYHSTNYDSTLGDLRGNVYTFQNDAVLERFGFDFSYVDWPCEMEFFVLQHDPTTNTWPVIYQQHSF